MVDYKTDLTEDKISEFKILENRAIVDYTFDFATSSAISRVSIKFLAVYIPILWLSGFLVMILWHGFFFLADISPFDNWILLMIFLPFMLVATYFVFIFGCAFFSKLFLILINIIHKPKEGIFRAEKGDTDFEFWCLRTELKKLIVWIMNNCPLPWIDTWAFRWFGVKIDFTSHLYDAWVDVEFLKFGRKVTIGQGAVVMSSMVVGKYLIIKKVFFGDYSVIGGVSNIAPGTIVGKDTVIGAFSSTFVNQILDPGWIYFGIPAMKLKPNKYAELRSDLILKRDVDEEKKYEAKTEIIIDEDKKDLL